MRWGHATAPIWLGFVLTMCTPTAAPDASTDAPAGLCTLLTGITNSGTVETICATVDEVVQIVALILTLRGVDAGVPPRATCTTLPGSGLCATPREIGMGVEFLVRKRTNVFMLDGGLDGGK